ncbi:MAG: ATP-binding protein [Bacteroidota bacterium]
MSDFIESQTLINFIVIEHVLLLLILSAAGYWAFFYIKDKRNYVSFLEALFNDYAHGILIFDKKQQLQYANNNGHSFLKDIYPNADPIKYLNECFDLFFDHAQDMDHVLESVLKNVKDQLPDRKIDYREIVKTKSNNFYFLTGYKTDDSQTTIHVIDINVEKRYEDLASRLGQTNQQLFQAIETTNTGIVVVSMQRAKNTINFVNRAFCEIAGKDRNDFLGADWRQFFSVFEEAKSDEDIHGLIQSIQHEEITDLDLTSFLGSQKRYYNFKITPYMNNKKEVDQYVGVLTDITDLRLREAEIFQSQKLDALGQLSAGIAHDFNNILSIIDGYTKISAKEVVDNENLIGYLNKISHASKRGSNLISRMLTFSRKKITNTSTYDIAEIIKDQESFLYPILDKSISLKINLPDFPIPVECNSDVISQIVMNLVINAQDAMSDGGEININLYTLKHTDLPEQYSNESQVLDYAYLRISDTGSGIDSDVLHQIFDPFFSTKDVGKGTGLGLSISYQIIVDKHRGQLYCNSTPGKGTEFAIEIPMVQK